MAVTFPYYMIYSETAGVEHLKMLPQFVGPSSTCHGAPEFKAECLDDIANVGALIALDILNRDPRTSPENAIHDASSAVSSGCTLPDTDPTGEHVELSLREAFLVRQKIRATCKAADSRF